MSKRERTDAYESINRSDLYLEAEWIEHFLGDYVQIMFLPTLLIGLLAGFPRWNANSRICALPTQPSVIGYKYVHILPVTHKQTMNWVQLFTC